MKHKILLAVLFLSPFLHSQQLPEQPVGMIPYGSFDLVKFDSVNIATGDLGLHIPLLSYPQRGSLPPVELFLTYQGPIFTNQCTYAGWGGSCAPVVPTPQAGFGVSLALTPSMAVNFDYNSNLAPTYATIHLTDSTGANHLMGHTAASALTSIDSTGYTISGSPDVSYASSFSVYDANGISYNFAGTSSIPYTFPAYGTVQDPNGNAVTATTGSLSAPWTYPGSITDSVGRVITTWGSGQYPTSAGCYTKDYPGISGTTDTTVHLTFCYSSHSITFPGTTTSSIIAAYGGSEFLLDSVTLPNSKQWSFDYTSYGDLNSVTTPAGATTTYGWSFNGGTDGDPGGLGVSPTPFGCGYNDVSYRHGVVSRSVNLNDGTPPYRWLYSATNGPGYNEGWTTVNDPNHNDTVHHFNGPTGSAGACPNEVETYYYSELSTGASPKLLKKVATDYESTADYPLLSIYNGNGNPFAYNDGDYSSFYNIVPKSVITTTYEGGSAAVTNESYYCYDNEYGRSSDTYYSWYCPTGTGTTFYDLNTAYGGGTLVSYLRGTKTAQIDFAFGAGTSPGSAVKITMTDYKWLDDPTYAAANVNLINTPSLVRVFDGFSTPAGQTAYNYDESGYITGSGRFGKVTSVVSGLSGQSITTRTYYDGNGMPSSTIDANGNALTYNYDTCGQLYAALNAAGQTTSYGHNCNTGLLTSVTDPNNATTAYSYDTMRDLTSITYPDTSTKSIDYHGYATPLNVTVTQDAYPDPSISTNTVYDSLVRPTQVTAPAGSTTETTYDGLGQVTSVTVPHWSGVAAGTTYFNYDGLGRKLLQTQPDGSAMWWCYSGLQDSTHPQPNCNAGSAGAEWVDRKDEAGLDIQQQTDGLGRMTAVIEADGYPTAYGYDTLGNLVSVNQFGAGPSVEPTRTRMFKYNSLSRVTSACNPEGLPSGQLCNGSNWSTTYLYDNNGNVTHKTDSRGLTLNYTYDNLNRVQNEIETSTGVNNWFYYDSASYDGITSTNPIGRLIKFTNSVNADTHFSYDAMGRVVNQWGHSTSFPYATGNPVSATYDLAGQLRTLTYPDGNTIQQTWNAAGEQITSDLISTSGGSTSQNYLQSFSPQADGSLYQRAFNGGKFNQTRGIDNRLQISSLLVGNATQNFFYHTYCYTNCSVPGVSNSTANNGNLYQVADLLESQYSQSYVYDPLNRIYQFYLNGGLQQQYYIDSFGNRDPSTSSPPSTPFNAQNQLANPGCAAIPLPTYDAAGNQWCDNGAIGGGVRNYVFDGKNQISGYSMYPNSFTTSPVEKYWYGADGNRVRKSDGTTSDFNEYVSFGGQIIAEYNSSAGWTDHVYANGSKLADLASTDETIHLSGSNTASGQASVWFASLPSSYTIRSGDKISWRQYQSGAARGGIGILACDGGTCANTNWSTSDTDGEIMNNDSRMNQWHERTVNFPSSFLNYSISNLWLTDDAGSGSGPWDMWFGDIAIYSSDGTVVPIYHRAPSDGLSFGSAPGVTSPSANVDPSSLDTTVVPAGTAAQEYLVSYSMSDHLGTAQLQLGGEGWPVWKGQFTPYGQEIAPEATTDNYKFTGKERDFPSGNDYFGARYYASSLGRFMSPDPSSLAFADQTNPQSFNLYSYAMNMPLRFVDPNGLRICDWGPSDNGGEDYDEDQDCEADGGVTVLDSTTVNVNSDNSGDMLEAVDYATTSSFIQYQQFPGAPSKTNQLLQCASKTANQFSIAGVLGLTGEGGGIGSTIGTALLGNTFSGIVDAGTHIYNNATVGGNGNEVMGDLILGGGRQGLPGGGPFSKGVAGIVTEAGVNAITRSAPVLSIAGPASEIGAEGLAGPVGWAKLGLDAAIFLGSALSCASR